MKHDIANQAVAAFQAGDYRRVRMLCRKALKKRARRSDMLELMGLAELRLGRPRQAQVPLETLIGLCPDAPLAHYNLGLAHYRAGDPGAAVAPLQRAVTLKPDLAEGWSDLALALHDCLHHDEAVAAAERACALEPEIARHWNNAGVVCQAYGLLEQAYESYRWAAELEPGNPVYLKNYGLALLGRGEKVEAEAYFVQALQLQPDYAEAWRHRVFTRSYEECDNADVSRLESLRQAPLAVPQRADVLFALGKIYADCARHDQAFACLREANALERDRLGFRPETLLRKYRTLCELFRDGYGKLARAASTTEGPRPIFIVGMPRSGTSLLERLLAGHSAVFPGGERYWLHELEKRLPSLTGSTQPYPGCLTELGIERLSELADQYRAHLAAIGDGSAWVTDKLPANFERIGLIRMLFPDAPIIHCERDPMDVCWSLYSQRFPDALHYAYDQDHLGKYAGFQQALMALWRECFPDEILSVRYEALVEDPRAVLQPLLGSIGLSWEEGCLQGPQRHWVNTASDHQVHAGVGGNTGGRWRPYSRDLDELRVSLDGAWAWLTGEAS